MATFKILLFVSGFEQFDYEEAWFGLFMFPVLEVPLFFDLWVYSSHHYNCSAIISSDIFPVSPPLATLGMKGQVKLFHRSLMVYLFLICVLF